MLSEKLKELFHSMNIQEELIEIDNYLRFYHEKYISKLKPLPERPDSLVGQNGLHFLQINLYRSHSLFVGCFEAINQNNFLMANLGTRAHQETTGSLAYFYNRLKSYYAENINEDQLDEIIRKLYLGIRKKDQLVMAPDPIGVMTLIDAVDDIVVKDWKLKDAKGKFRELYEDLSELCHPNSFGLITAAKINKEFIVRYRKLENIEPDDLNFVYALMNSAALYEYIYVKVFSLLSEKEQLPIIIK